MAGRLASPSPQVTFGLGESELPDQVLRGNKGELKRVIAREEALLFNAKNAGKIKIH